MCHSIQGFIVSSLFNARSGVIIIKPLLVSLYFFLIGNAAIAQGDITFAYDLWPDNIRVSLVDEKQFSKVTRQQLFLSVPFAESIPFYLAFPNNTKITTVVLLLHGITSSKDIWWQGSGPYSKVAEYRQALLAAGYAVVAIDSRFHGQRAHRAGYHSPRELATENKPHALRDQVVDSVIDVRRVIDYLQTRKEFAAASFGALGISLGAIHSIALAAADDRIEFTVPIFPPPKAPAPAWQVFPMGIAAQVNTDTLLLLANQDEYYTLAEGEALFASFASSNKQLMILNSKHDPDLTKAPEVLQWIENRSVHAN